MDGGRCLWSGRDGPARQLRPGRAAGGDSAPAAAPPDGGTQASRRGDHGARTGGCRNDAPAAAAATSAPAAAQRAQPVAPMAAAGKLPQSTITVAIFAGPEADAHVRLGPKFTDYTQGKVTVKVEQIARDDYDAKWLATMQAKSTTWDVVHDNATASS